MDQTTYQQWWQLHLRVARGDSLSPDEQSSYHAGRRKLELEERVFETEQARQAREHLTALEAERTDLERRRQQLDAEIDRWESQLKEPTRQYLGVGD